MHLTKIMIFSSNHCYSLAAHTIVVDTKELFQRSCVEFSNKLQLMWCC